MPYENLNLNDWPFRTSADEAYASVWAGRAQTKKQLKGLLQKMELVPKSGLHVFWANFGMGKTHTLYHLKYLSLQSKGRIIPIYAVMPMRSIGFLELYREIVQSFLSTEMRDYLGKQLVELGQNIKGTSLALHPMFSRSPGVVNALLAIRSGNIEETTAAMQWLIAQPGLPGSATRAIGVNYRIKTPEDAISALGTLINLCLWGGKQHKQLLLMIDEFQRIGELKPAIVSQINSSLHTVFNSRPTGLQLLLTFSFGRKEHVDAFLSPELKSRAEPQPINLDVLTCEEGFVFLRELLEQFRINKDGANPVFPFSKSTVDIMLTNIAEKKTLTPRRIMKYANEVLVQHMINASNSQEQISEDFMRTCVNELLSSDLDTDLVE
jgi:hypothetical protein